MADRYDADTMELVRSLRKVAEARLTELNPAWAEQRRLADEETDRAPGESPEERSTGEDDFVLGDDSQTEQPPADRP